jgi:hypothetical protein
MPIATCRAFAFAVLFKYFNVKIFSSLFSLHTVRNSLWSAREIYVSGVSQFTDSLHLLDGCMAFMQLARVAIIFRGIAKLAFPLFPLCVSGRRRHEKFSAHYLSSGTIYASHFLHKILSLSHWPLFENLMQMFPPLVSRY